VASDVTALERLEEHSIAVDAHAIEEEFARVWRATESEGEPGSTVRVRAINLLAIGAEPADVDRFEQVMQTLPQRHPCRGMFALAAAPHEKLEATISAHCWRTGGARRHVCSEEVMLTGAAGQEQEVASAVLALLVPDLPAAVWLMGDPARPGGLARRLVDAGESVIVDSARAPMPREAFAAIMRVEEEHDLPCLDLAWARLAVWRGLIAQMFDGDAGGRELQQIKQITICGGAGGASSEAMLLAGWLASRLDLGLADVGSSGGGFEASLYEGSRSVRLSIAPGAIALERAVIRTADAEFAIERHADSGHLHLREAWDSGATRRVVDQPPEDEGATIALTLDGLGEIATYRDARAVAISLLSG
jgi:glucose-6-phosphate dehydrogenase assembly protein OpcA